MRDFGIGLAVAGLLLTATAHAEGLFGFRLLELDGHRVSWRRSADGQGTTVTYAFATERTSFSGALNCEELVPAGRLLSRSGIDDVVFRSEVAAAFAIWEEAADIHFVAIADPDAAGILIGAQGRPRGRAYTNVSSSRVAGQTTSSIDRALICLNPEQPWKVGFDGNLASYDLRYTIAHEIGHAIGLDHPGLTDAVMSFRYDERYRALQSGDRAGAVALYGARRHAEMARSAVPNVNHNHTVAGNDVPTARMSDLSPNVPYHATK